VVDGTGKRLRINVRPVLAAELQVIPEGGKVHAGLDLSLSTSTSQMSLDMVVRDERLVIRERLDRPLALLAGGLAARAGKVELPLGRTTLTAANGEYNEESGRAVTRLADPAVSLWGVL